MKLVTPSAIPVYTVSGSSTARPLPEWLARRRKRSLKRDAEYNSRIELLQDFEFDEASQCIRISEDGDWVMSTGTYKPQIHAHNLPQLSLSFSRHTNTLNTSFELLSSDYSKSIHLQEDRTLEFHTPQGCHYVTRLPRYGRDLKYSKHTTEALVPSVGVNENGKGEVFRLHLEHGKFLRSYEIELSPDDQALAAGADSGIGGQHAVNTMAIAETSHNLLAFGTSIGTVEFWDPRARDRIGILSAFTHTDVLHPSKETTAIDFHGSGLTVACGSSSGMIHLYDLRSPIPPLLSLDESHHGAISTLIHLTPSSKVRMQSDEPKFLSASKRGIKIWESRSGTPWTSVEASVDLNSVVWCKDSGMLLTANEGRQQHIFFIPQLGPAPKWCTFLDSLVEEMAEDASDPNAFARQSQSEVYENYKFLTSQQLDALSLSHLVGTTSLMRPYMHGYFVPQALYENAKLISDPFMLDADRAKKVRERIEKERNSRIRATGKIPGQVNRGLAAKLLEKETVKKTRSQRQQDDVLSPEDDEATKETPVQSSSRPTLLSDPRFTKLFTDDAYTIDETSREFQQLNPSTDLSAVRPNSSNTQGLTAVEQIDLQELSASSSEDGDSDRDTQNNGENLKVDPSTSAVSYKRKKKQDTRSVRMTAETSGRPREIRDRSFGSRNMATRNRNDRVGGIVGERETTFVPERKGKQRGGHEKQHASSASRRSASGNTFRRL